MLVLLLGPDQVFARLALFFSQMAVVTFGGAYAVLAYVAQAAVETYGWLTPGEMLDGLGMAETTPGPLIMVRAVRRLPRRLPRPGRRSTPTSPAVLASVLVTWVTFAPCFLWIFLGAPYIERLRAQPRPRRRARRDHRGGRRRHPEPRALVRPARRLPRARPASAASASTSTCRCSPASTWRRWPSSSRAMVATFRFRVGMLPLLAGAALLGCLWQLFGP